MNRLEIVDSFQVSDLCHVLHRCIKYKDLASARIAHSIIIRDNLDKNDILGGLLVQLFSLCQSLIDVNLAFCQTLKPNLLTWHAIICAYESLGECQQVVDLYGKLQEQDILPDKLIFVSIVKACGSICDKTQGFLVHDKIVKLGLDLDVAIGTTLVRMYCKWDYLSTGHEVFSNLRNRNVVTWGAIIDGYAQRGHALAALDLFCQMHREGIEPNKVIFLSVLKACSSVGNLLQGQCLHCWILRSGLEIDVCVENALIYMYAKHGNVKEAEYLFLKSKKLDVVSYGTMILGYVQHGYDLCALRLFAKMQNEGTISNRYIFSCTLKACGNMKSLEQGRLLHGEITKYAFESCVAVGSALVDMYIKCECLSEAIETFETLPSRNDVSWSVMILGCAQLDRVHLCFDFFNRMVKDDVMATSVTFLGILKACVILGSLEHGRLIHAQVLESGFEQNVPIGSALVDMYAKCQSIEDARKSFNVLPEKNIVAWCAMMWGYVDQGQGPASLELLEKMPEENLKPNNVTFLCALKACESCGSLVPVRLVHELIVKSGFELDTVLGSAAIDMYTIYGSLGESRKVFDMLQTRDVVAWSAMITAYSQHGDSSSAIELFKKMQVQGLKLDKVMVSAVIKAYALLGDLVQGMLIHHESVHDGFDLDCIVRNTLVDMYAKCGSVRDAEQLFFSGLSTCDIVSWGVMVEAYAQCGDCLNAVQLFEKMQLHGIEPNASIFVSVLKACSSNIQQGRQIHEQVIRCGFHTDKTVCNALIDMYVKCGNVEQAYKLFNNVKEPDVISWGTMIVGFAQHGLSFSALHLYENMVEQGIKASDIILPCILKACGMVGAVGQGMQIHDHVIRSQLEDDVAIGSALLGMYAKFGRLFEARKVLDNLPNRDVKSWNAMVSGYMEHDECILAKKCLEGMQQDGLQSQSVTHTSILAACSHIGNVKEGCEYFLAMSKEHFVTPSVEHVNCMINLLANVGYLYEAEQLLCTMPVSTNIIGWTSLLNACKMYGSKSLGRQCFVQAAVHDPCMGSRYVIMYDMHSHVHAINVY